MSTERRRAERVNCRIFANASPLGSDFGASACRIEDFSSDGLRMTCDDASDHLQPGSRIRVEIGSIWNAPIGRVVWRKECLKGTGPAEVGVRLVWMSRDTLDLLFHKG